MPRTSATMRRNGPYAPLSAHYSRDDAILALDASEDDLAELLFLRSLAYCAGDPRLDGFISDAALRAGVVLRRRRQERVVKAAAVLADLGLFVRESNGYRLRTWAKWNRTNAEIEQKREVDRVRKAGGPPPDDEPPPDPGDEPPADSPPTPNGFHAEPDRNPQGTQGESLGVASRGRAGASNATHSNAVALQRIADASPPNPPPPAAADTGDPRTTDLSPRQIQAITGLAAELHRMRPAWSTRLIEAPLYRLARTDKSWTRILIAAITVTLDPKSDVPQRLMSDGYWWRDNDTRTQAALSRWTAAGHDNPTKALA